MDNLFQIVILLEAGESIPFDSWAVTHMQSEQILSSLSCGLGIF